MEHKKKSSKLRDSARNIPRTERRKIKINRKSNSETQIMTREVPAISNHSLV